MNTLEPARNVRRKCHLRTEMGCNLPLVNVIRQRVRHDVVGQNLDIILGTGLGASTRVAGNSKDGGHAREVRDKRRNGKLSGGSIAAWIGNALRVGNSLTVLEFYGEG